MTKRTRFSELTEDQVSEIIAVVDRVPPDKMNWDYFMSWVSGERAVYLDEFMDILRDRADEEETG